MAGLFLQKSALQFVCALLTWGWMGSRVECGEEYVYQLYARKENTNRSVACGVCAGLDGTLARRPALDDWEIKFGNLTHLAEEQFWVDLFKTDTGQWMWGDWQLLDMNNIGSLPMQEAFSSNYTGKDCATWTMHEPFLMPALCSDSAGFVCQLRSSSGCFNSELNGQMIESASPSLMEYVPKSKDDCISSCDVVGLCWAGDWNSDTGMCRLLKATGNTRPALPQLRGDLNYVTFGRTCKKYEEMSAEDSEFVCNCGAIELPETEEEKEKFLENHKEEVNRELIVPTETLSATIRKKESAPDERTSSTSIGFLGLTLMVVVFGGLVLMDLTSLLAHIKMAASNFKTTLVQEEEGVSEA